MDDATRQENQHFEDEVRRIARSLWPSDEFSGAQYINGREVDGIFVTETSINIIEATTSTRRNKAEQDIKKLANLINDRRKATSYTKHVQGWFITRSEPTADQRGVSRKYRNDIIVLSFSQFQSRLIDSKDYISLRDNYDFGSVRDPATGHKNNNIQYIPLDLLEVNSKDIFERDLLIPQICQGAHIVFLGDYGAGKSMTLREIYRELRKIHMKGKSSKFPLYLNLRDHSGQTDTAEIIERHARKIGFGKEYQLVRA